MRFVPVLVLLGHLVVVTSAAGQSAKTPRLDVNGDPLPEGAVARLGSLRFQPLGHVAALSPDGRIVATATHDQKVTSIHLMDTSTGKTLRKLDVDHVGGQQLQFLPKSKSLVFTGFTVVDLAAGKIAKPIDPSHTSDSAIALTSDGNRAAAQLYKLDYDAPVASGK